MLNDTSRYLDDIFTIDYPEFVKHISDIYPTELQLNKANCSDKETSFLDLNINVIGSDVHTSVYEKRENFGFPIVDFPLQSDNIPSPLIVSRDSFSLWTWARVQTARSTAYFNGCPYIFLIYYYITIYVCVTHFYDLSALVGCWSSNSIRRIIFKCVSFWIHGLCGKWEGWALVNWFHHTSWATVVTPTDRLKSVRNRCVIEVVDGFFLCCQVAFWIFLWL